MESRPLILVTNDDGIVAPGIRALVEIACEFGEVVVVAPDSPQSGKGHAVTLTEPIRYNKVQVFDNVPAFDCTGTPVDCVKLAKHVLLHDRNIDLCLSGINHGSNASVNILYSGTMSAAMEASLEGIQSIGFSLMDFSYNADFEPSRPYIRQIIKHVLDHGQEVGNLLNVNIPALSADKIQGIRVCRQAVGRWVEEFAEGQDPRGEKYYWLKGAFVVDDEGTDHDIWALENGYVSVVPSNHDLTHYQAFDSLKPLMDSTNHQ